MYSRRLNDRTLTLTTSGWTYTSQHVLYDYETGSLWFHIGDDGALTCIGGKLAGRSLEGIDAENGSWHSWREAHPMTKWLIAPLPPR